MVEAGATVPGIVRGYASRFGECDRGGDVVAPGAFRRALARLKARGGRLAFLWQHDPARPIGVWDRAVEDRAGLHVEGRLLEGVQAGREAAAMLSAGAIDGLSIGYRVLRAEPRVVAGRRCGRRLTEIDLWEVSLVTFPMLPSARASIGARAESGRHRLAGSLARAVVARADTRPSPHAPERRGDGTLSDHSKRDE
ncbi:MAG: HK97 family phage prohead protease [Pseudomonadota bacterium]